MFGPVSLLFCEFFKGVIDAPSLLALQVFPLSLALGFHPGELVLVAGWVWRWGNWRSQLLLLLAFSSFFILAAVFVLHFHELLNLLLV